MGSPTPKSEASRTKAQNEARDATKDKSVVPVTQDPNGPGVEERVLDSDGNETPKSSRALRAGATTQPANDVSQDFCDACDDVASGVKKLTEAGMGGGEAGKLALEIWRETHG